MAKKRSKSNNKRKKKYKKYTQRSKVVIPQNKLNKNDDRKKDNKDLEEDLKKLKNKIKDKKQQDTVELKYTISTEEMLKDDFKVTIDEHTNNIDIIVEKVKKEDSTKNEQKKKTTNKTSKKIIVGASIILLVTTLYILFMPRIILNGKNTLVINYKQKYKEPGYKAVILNKELNSSIKSYGKVNVNKLGTYKIKYILNYKGIRRIKYRKVIVKDMTKPFIKLNGYKKTYVCPNTKYQEEGFIAYDNYDKDITKKVKIIKDDNKYVYKVKDSSGNKTTSIRNLIYEDNVKPVISISENIFINEGDSYENKYFAIDNCDKDITSKVKVTGSVNSNKAGEYKLPVTLTLLVIS